RRRRQVGDLPVRRAAHQHIAAALARAALDPVDVAAIDPDLAEAERLADDQFRGDRRAPGAVGESFTIGHYFAAAAAAIRSPKAGRMSRAKRWMLSREPPKLIITYPTPPARSASSFVAMSSGVPKIAVSLPRWRTAAS